MLPFAGRPIELLEARRLLSAGMLDPAFGVDGVDTRPSLATLPNVTASTSEPDGKILIGGTAGLNVPYLARFNADGSLDRRFGRKTLPLNKFFGRSTGFIETMALAPDGRIVFAGSAGGQLFVARMWSIGVPDTSFGTRAGIRVSSINLDDINLDTFVAVAPDLSVYVAGELNGGFAVARFSARGQLDTLFGPDGTGVVRLGPTPGSPGLMKGIAVQRDGKVVIAGNPDSDTGIIERLNPDGTLDNSFGGTGVRSITVGGAALGFTAFAPLADGKLILAGGNQAISGAQGDGVVVRLNADGTLDRSFNGSGISAPVPAVTIVPAPHGQIILFSNEYLDSADELARFGRLNADGSIDGTFNDGNGVKLLALDNSFPVVMHITPDGHIVAVGRAGDLQSAVMAELNRDGTLNTSFGEDGRVQDFGGLTKTDAAVGMQSTGKIIVGGTYSDTSPGDFALTRYNADGTIDRTFQLGVIVTHFPGFSSTITTLFVQPDDKIVAVGYVYDAYRLSDETTLALARYLPSGRLDTSFGTNGLLVLRPPGDAAFVSVPVVSIAAAPGGKFLVTSGTYSGSEVANTGYAVQLLPNGSLDTTFGTGGWETTATPMPRADAPVTEPDGKLLSAGVFGESQPPMMAVRRFIAFADPDTTFGNNGVSESVVGTALDAAFSPTDDTLVVVGKFGPDDAPGMVKYLLG